MREVAFIKKNKTSWLAIEQLLQLNAPPEKLSQAFDKLNNDLAFSQTYYPKSKLVNYLNGLTLELYHKIYKPKKDWLGIKKLFIEEVPLISYKYRYYLYFSMFFFMSCMALGALSAHDDSFFIRSVLGDEYVNNTLENIENGDPTAVYNSSNIFDDSFSAIEITLNNLWVGLQSFFYGLIAGIGTLYIMFINGIRVGAFLQMFQEYNVFWKASQSIFIHGSMELFVIMVEGAAGIVLGLSYLFPGSITRMQSLKLKGKQSIKWIISTFPFTIFAGILEGFVTQKGKDMPLILAWFIILSTLFFICYYYVIFPIRKARKYVKKVDFNFDEEYES